MKKHSALLTILLLGFSSMAFAHPGHGLPSAFTGFMHPLTGWDHLLVMLAVGVWAAKLGGKARWQLPLTFLAMMALGAVLGMIGLSFNDVETAIAASVMAMGVLLIISLPMKLSTQLGITALFAVLHGMAHGLELQTPSRLAAFVGMIIATALLHGVGVLLGSQQVKIRKWLQHGLAYTMLLVGTYWLVAA
jgi:urease accessory protein